MRKKTPPGAMKFLPVMTLLALVLEACIPTGAPPEAPVTPPGVEASATPTSEMAVEPQEATPAAIQPEATPRGPDLVASDPGSVTLASGGLQLVEFFRFT